jgi:hypothetical protein
MRRDLERRIKSLEQSHVSGFPNKLRFLARLLGEDEEWYMLAVKGYEREMDRHLSPRGAITMEGFLLLDDLLRRSVGMHLGYAPERQAFRAHHWLFGSQSGDRVHRRSLLRRSDRLRRRIQIAPLARHR